MHLPYLVKLDGTTPSCIFFGYLCILIEQCKLSHGEETLKYRQLILDENTGIQRYPKKIHEGVVPSNSPTLLYELCHLYIYI
jgi:hypothetical protein